MKFFQKICEILKSKEKKRIIVLDASALEIQSSMQIIEQSYKVILLTGTIRELDNAKNKNNIYGVNARIIAKKSREDENSQKYICVAGYEKNSYQDDNIIDYCRKNRKTVILTNDNNLCNMAKAYHIPYIFAEDEEQNIKEKETCKKANNIKGAVFLDEKLYILNNIGNRINFVYRNNENIQNNSVSKVELQIGDIVYQAISKKDSVVVVKYKVIEISKSNYASVCCHYKINLSETEVLKDLLLPEKVKDEIMALSEQSNNKKIKVPQIPNNKMTLKKENKEKVKESKKEQKKQLQLEILFLPNFIRVKYKKNYYITVKLEREGTLIDLKDYNSGDILYILKYDTSQICFEIEKHIIVFKDNKYESEKIEEQRIWYVNEIYKLNICEELKEEIRKLFLEYTGY